MTKKVDVVQHTPSAHTSIRWWISAQHPAWSSSLHSCAPSSLAGLEWRRWATSCVDTGCRSHCLSWSTSQSFLTPTPSYTLTLQHVWWRLHIIDDWPPLSLPAFIACTLYLDNHLALPSTAPLSLLFCPLPCYSHLYTNPLYNIDPRPPPPPVMWYDMTDSCLALDTPLYLLSDVISFLMWSLSPTLFNLFFSLCLFS